MHSNVTQNYFDSEMSTINPEYFVRILLAYTVIHFYFGANLISVISVEAFFYLNLIST